MAKKPPVRRGPVTLRSDETPIDAEMAAAVSAELVTSESAASATEAAGPQVMVRRGSPFSNRGVATIERMHISVTALIADTEPAAGTSRPVRRGESGGALTCAAITLPIGVIAMGLAFWFPAGGLVLAGFGVVIGCWGLGSRRRNAALIGLLLCCLVLAIAAFNTALDVYRLAYGVEPW